MSIQSARQLLRDYCKPVNYSNLIEALADEKGINRSGIQALIDSGEFTIETDSNRVLIRRNPKFKPTPSNRTGTEKKDLLAAIDAAQVFSFELNQTVKDMKWQSVKCPFHEDTNPSFRILLPDGGFECKGCGERGGNIIDFTMKLHNLDFPQAINHLATYYTTMRAQS